MSVLGKLLSFMSEAFCRINVNTFYLIHIFGALCQANLSGLLCFRAREGTSTNGRSPRSGVFNMPSKIIFATRIPLRHCIPERTIGICSWGRKMKYRDQLRFGSNLNCNTRLRGLELCQIPENPWSDLENI